MLMQGASNKVIARNLVITESTVKVHMKAILRKLRLQNRTQAAIWARNHVNEADWNNRAGAGAGSAQALARRREQTEDACGSDVQ